MCDGRGTVVAIDGPSGVGKSTISRNVASCLDFTYLDTGAMYRAVAWYLSRKKVDINNLKDVEQAIDEIRIELFPPKDADSDIRVVLNGEDIGQAIRTPEMSMFASKVSAIPEVRRKLTDMQQQIGKKGKIVAEGRDTTTVVFPDAAFKFYLDATPEERTRRRVLQLRTRGQSVDEEKALEMTIKRDKSDSERSIAPLRRAEDAVYIDTTGISADQVLEKIISEVRKKR